MAILMESSLLTRAMQDSDNPDAVLAGVADALVKNYSWPIVVDYPTRLDQSTRDIVDETAHALNKELRKLSERFQLHITHSIVPVLGGEYFKLEEQQ